MHQVNKAVELIKALGGNTENQAPTLPSIQKPFLSINVIMTFNTLNSSFESQGIFNMYLPIGNQETSAVDFLNRLFFDEIVLACQDFDRDIGDLMKISTASDWGTFEKATGLKSICTLGHSAKWCFSPAWKRPDAWEKMLIKKYGFGVNV